MPARDGTGPQGSGPMTGRGVGLCAGDPEQESRNDFRPGFGRGFRGGFGRGAGRGFRQRFGRGGRRFGDGRGWRYRNRVVDESTDASEQD
jgi:hypothetical protein